MKALKLFGLMVLALAGSGLSAQANDNLDLGVDVQVDSRWGVGIGFGWGPGRGHGPGRGWGPGRGHHYQPYFVCSAQNARGHIFRAEGFRPNFVQQRAIDQCYSYSRRCQPLGCYRVR